ncbi:MAG: hypothetical protein HUJ65_03290 [Oscillospiraceae bacterium]|nr:hypothetical protein [Oscillospiraceae bacterium]
MLNGDSGAHDEETPNQIFLDEGRRTMGVWLPLAMADIAQLLTVLCHRVCWDSSDLTGKIPSRSEMIKSWMLPAMSEALKVSEDEAEAVALYNAVEKLGERFGANRKESLT